MATGLSEAARTERHLARNALARAEAEALAEAGIHRALAELTGMARNDAWKADHRARSMTMPHGSVEVTIEDEGGKVDLNDGADGLLRALLQVLGLGESEATALAAAIADFRDDDDLRRIQGAEEMDYRAAGSRYRPANRPFTSIDDLRFVLGMPTELVPRLAPSVTVHSRQYGVDPAVAGPDVAAALLALRGRPASRSVKAGEAGDDAAFADARDRFVSPSTGKVFTIRARARGQLGGVAALDATARITRSTRRPFVMHDWKSR